MFTLYIARCMARMYQHCPVASLSHARIDHVHDLSQHMPVQSNLTLNHFHGRICQRFITLYVPRWEHICSNSVYLCICTEINRSILFPPAYDFPNGIKSIQLVAEAGACYRIIAPQGVVSSRNCTWCWHSSTLGTTNRCSQRSLFWTTPCTFYLT